MQGFKTIGKHYRVLKALFQINSYLYAQVGCKKKHNISVVTAALYVYENEDPSQCLKMLREKLDFEQHDQLNYLIFPYSHVKESFNDKNISLFFINDYIIPLRNCKLKQFTTLQFLQILHGGLSSLNQLHMRDITHGNIKLKTSYLVKNKQKENCKFAFNILDTNYFTQEDAFEDIQDKLFLSQGQSLGQNPSFKDDLESLVYVMTHLISKGKFFTLKRFQLEWITESQFLRWKNCQFFRQMINILPPQMEILIEIYTIAKTLRRNQKPDYLKLIRKVLNVMAAHKYARKTATKRSMLEEASIKNMSKAYNINGKSNHNASDDNTSMKMKVLSEEDINIELKYTKQKKKKGSPDEVKEVQFQI